ncbi:MAG TPA: DUF2238 domain-containing protein [Planctomycetota bacterium]|nr:DUF2238 domain-containing protein [Planctomycetota bacterium]
MTGTDARKHWPIWTLVVLAVVSTVWSAVHPREYDTWFFEIMLGVPGVVVLVVVYRRFRFSSLVYLVCAVHFVVLAVGAKYTYAEVPLFNWMRETLSLSRNHFDRVGHFLQGFTPALLCRELLLRTSRLGRGKWLSFICVAVPLAFSAFYELLETWWVLAFYPTSGPEWLGHQGDIWDAQWDMTMALLGAMLAVFVFGRLHDRTMRTVPAPSETEGTGS